VQQRASAARTALESHPMELVPSHCDPLCENFLDTGERMYLIDYEYAGNNDPMWDLGDLSVEAQFGPEQDEALRTYAAQGYDLVFAHGFEFQGAAERVSAEYPKTAFVVTSGSRVQGNVAPLIFRLEEASYLAGMVAGGLTRTGILGFVGGIELPPIKAAYQGWVNGAKAVNPKVQSREIYLNSFDDAAAGREAAIALIRVGADMFHHNADAAALGLFQAAKESAGVYVFGANADQSSLAPDRVVGSAIIDLPRAFLLMAREVKGGTFKPQVEAFGLSSGVVRYQPNPALDSLVPAALKARVRAAADSIAAGTLLAAPRPESMQAFGGRGASGGNTHELARVAVT